MEKTKNTQKQIKALKFMVDELQTKNQQSMHDMLDSTFIAQENRNAISYLKNQATQNSNDIIGLQANVNGLKDDNITQALAIEDLCKFRDSTGKKINTIETNITSNKNDICNIQSSLIDAKDAIEQNTKDIEKANTKIDKNAQNIQLLLDSKTSTGQSLTTIVEKVDNNTAQISALKADVQTNKTNISTLQLDMQTAQSNIEINSQNISTNAQNIDNNSKLIDEISKQQTTNTANITSLQAQQQTNTQNIENNSQQILQLQTAKTDILTNVTNLSKGVETNSKNILQNQTNILANANDINALKTSAQTNTVDIATLKTSKQNALTAGTNITISPDNVISASGGSFTAGQNISINDGVISCTAPTYTAGKNITIDQDNKISATSKIYTAGQNIDIDDADVISCTVPTYSAGANIQISADNTISAMAVAYTAGQNIEITDDGVISSTAGSGLTQQQVEQINSNSTNILSLQNSVQQNTTDIASLKNLTTDTGTLDVSALSQNVQTNTTDIATLKQQMAQVLTPADPSYQPKTYTDYPAGTIIKTYDCYDREVYFKLDNKITLPTIYFCAEPEGEATIKLSINMYVNKAGKTCTVSAYLNGTKIDDEFVDITQKDKSITFTKTYYQQALNTQAKGNNFYVIVQVTGVSYNYPIIINNYKAEFEAPNADIINKILPFNVEYFDGTYYFSDCSTGIAKTAQIDAELLHNIKNLSWVDTGIPAQKYYHVPNLIYSGDVYKLDNINYMILQKDNSSKFRSEKYNYTFSTSPLDVQFIPKHIKASRTYFLEILTGRVYNRSLDLTSKASYTSNETSHFYTKYYAPKTFAYPNTSIISTTLRIDENGMVSAWYGGSSIPLGYGTNAIFYQTEYLTQTTAKYVAFVKHFTKIIKYEFARLSSGLTLTNSTELGNYDDFFLGANNDYFVVKGQKLEYHKF
jgi:hypothetical protein